MEELTTNQSQEFKTKKCPHCFADIPEPATYCRVCGQKVAESNTSNTEGRKHVKIAPIFGAVFIIAAIVLFIYAVNEADYLFDALIQVLLGIAALILGSTLIAKK